MISPIEAQKKLEDTDSSKAIGVDDIVLETLTQEEFFKRLISSQMEEEN